MSMTITMLAWSVVLGLLHIALAATFSVARNGLGWALSARDVPKPPLDGVGGRLQRASLNFLETFALFAAVLLAALAMGRTDAELALGAQLYFWGRLAYLPLYALGIPVLRTLAWVVAMVGLVLVLLTLF
ncbi:MAPEG family protein [Oleiagrimonas sp. MCCC 1A03011]|uniref:MAPEG family protein n=1 Tax=Oleiagrimonas sp. MCCC 1A03011 TaxID=1926883 RepID=UPI000DC3D241|nr:MAPEG family protein [Oleiagrimonas sp. MCCC 1A03011]RAP58354.1 hypothetical protein BTJ49_05220 [Oleiagrimonas sp. MCCC 1A03011]